MSAVRGKPRTANKGGEVMKKHIIARGDKKRALSESEAKRPFSEGEAFLRYVARSLAIMPPDDKAGFGALRAEIAKRLETDDGLLTLIGGGQTLGGFDLPARSRAERLAALVIESMCAQAIWGVGLWTGDNPPEGIVGAKDE
jgi:hypothetical protein